MATQNFRSVPEMLLHRVQATPDSVAFQYPTHGGWTDVTWAQFGQRVRHIASGLRALGIKDEQRCALLSGTRYEWIAADLGILCAGAATTTIYPSSTAEECAYILKDSNTVAVFVENEEQLKKVVERRGELPALQRAILFEGAGGHDGFAISLAELEAMGRQYEADDPARYEATARSIQPTSLATLIYTSGTTGRPKGVELTHDCWVFEAEGIDQLRILVPSDVQYLWLPLAHSFGKVLTAAQLRIGFRTAVDGRVEKLVENLAVIRPTFVAAVPRIFEKVHNKVIQQAKAGGGAKSAIFSWALDVGLQVSRLRQQGKSASGLLAVKHAIADKLVFSKLRDRFGGRLRYFVSGAAPLSRDIAEFFHAAGLLILEGYGLTESSAASFVNRPEKWRFGTVGPPLPGVEVKIAPSDGEILIRGRGIMRGYHGLPEATAETLDKDGWLHTGDIGEITDGCLRITDRKKDLIKTSGGKYVAPQELEGKLKAICPIVSQVVVHGNNRNFCSALLTLDEESLRPWAKENGLGHLTYAQLAAEPGVKALFEPYVKELNSSLPSYATIKKFALLPADLSLEGGELTPSQKVKRKAVEQKYAQLLDSFYAGGGGEG